VSQALITFASVMLAAAFAYLAALAGWRLQQRREVYGNYIAAADDVLDSLDLLLVGPSDKRVADLHQWDNFRQNRHKFDTAWGQVRLVAPNGLAAHASKTGFALLEFERTAKDVTVENALSLRDRNPFLGWQQAHVFVEAARRDIKVESRILKRWRREKYNMHSGSGGQARTDSS
jgi:hypothetical protein